MSKLLKRVAHEGFRVVALRQLRLGEEHVRHVVPANDQQVKCCLVIIVCRETSAWLYHAVTVSLCVHLLFQNEAVWTRHADYLTSDVSVTLCLQRENAVKRLLELLGPVDAKLAKRQSSFHWRAMFGTDAISNAF